MTDSIPLIAIYDFEFFPFALGDILTWNVQTAIQCEVLGRRSVDIYICVDKQYPAFIHQRDQVNSDNFELYFSEVYGAFGTHPKLSNIFIFHQRQIMLNQLKDISALDTINLTVFNDYLAIVKHSIDNHINKTWLIVEKKIRESMIIRKMVNYFVTKKTKQLMLNHFSTIKALENYFTKHSASHNRINEFANKHGYVPLLQPSLGCVSDVDNLINNQFSGKKIVTFHLRLRRLDLGYGGQKTHDRDSNFLEWCSFLKEAGKRYPEIQFVALGRMQEKPLVILQLANVTSLRSYGMSLGHELTFMLKSDLFIGSSSGFAAMANFSLLPYFITKMNANACRVYAIAEGASKLPFAKENQQLIYTEETSTSLMRYLEKGLRFNV